MLPKGHVDFTEIPNTVASGAHWGGGHLQSTTQHLQAHPKIRGAHTDQALAQGAALGWRV